MSAPLRDEFPILDEKTYLASHSLGAVPEAARQALDEYHEAWATQGIRAWEGPWLEAWEGFTDRVADLFGADENTVAPMLNATRGMAGVASALDLDERPKIVMTDLEFTTSYPLFRGLEELGAEIEIVESDDGVSIDPQRVADAIDDDTALAHTCHVYFRSGAKVDVAPIVEAADEHGAHTLLDVYQSAGVVPIDVNDLGVNFVVGGSHKWLCGGPGAGFLYVEPELCDSLDPWLRGWFGSEGTFDYDTGTDKPAPAKGAQRFLGGTPNVPAFFAAREGLDRVLEVGVDRIRERTLDLTDRILVHADAQDLDVRTPREKTERGATVCLQFEGAEEATEQLAERDMLVDYRPDCGMRISPHFYNTETEIDDLFGELARLRK
jgi:kynureninase